MMELKHAIFVDYCLALGQVWQERNMQMTMVVPEC
jgi:hypothetical protein